MRHRSFRRLAAALVNLLFLLAWGEPVTSRPCPTHDAPAVAGMTSHHAAASAHGAAHQDASSHHDHAQHEGAHLCRCLGQCCAAVGATAPAAQALRWQVVVRRLAAASFDEPDAPRVATVRLLPFANGPPRTA